MTACQIERDIFLADLILNMGHADPKWVAQLLAEHRTGYVPDLTCIVRRKRRWFDPRNMGDSTAICGRVNVEQYLRQGYVFDWEATDKARKPWTPATVSQS